MAGCHWFPNRSWRRRLIQCSLTFSRPNQWSEILGKFPSIFFQLIWNQCQLCWKPYHWKLSGECSLLSILGKQSQRSDSGASWNPTNWNWVSPTNGREISSSLFGLTRCGQLYLKFYHHIQHLLGRISKKPPSTSALTDGIRVFNAPLYFLMMMILHEWPNSSFWSKP